MSTLTRAAGASLNHSSLSGLAADDHLQYLTQARGDARYGSAAGATQLYRRGVNMAGGEFAPNAATLPGAYGTDYSYDDAAALAGVAARGHKIVRLPIRWERIQPTRGAALNAAELTRIQAAVANIAAAGMACVIDVHNYGRYINSTVNGGATLILGGTLPVADLVDLWTRLSAAFQNDSGVYAYGLMNEPFGFTGATGSFTGSVRYDWASGVQGWTGDTAGFTNVSGQGRMSQALGSGSVLMRKDDAAAVSGGSAVTGNVLRVKATPVALPTGTWTAKTQWQTAGFAWQNPTSVVLTRVDTGAVVTSLTVGQPVYVTCTFSTIASPPNAFAIQVDGSGATAGTVTVDFDDFSQGAQPGAQTGAQVWESASQQVVTAIRARGDLTKLMVPGYGYSGAQSWTVNHSAPWISDPSNNHAYEAHYYFDSDNSGDYPDSYATENSFAVIAGYASLTARVTAEFSRWTGWLNTHNVRGFVGEIGWPDNADAASWNAVGEALYDLCDAAEVDVTYWSAGARWGTAYTLSVYTGATQSTVKAQAAVVEAHPTALASNSDLTGRIATLEQGGGTRRAEPHYGPAWMVLGADTAPELATAKAAGATHGLVEVFWDRCQSAAAGAVDASTAITGIDLVRGAGLKVCLRVSLQYPPQFVKDNVPKFKRAGGTDHTAAADSGKDIRDWVWSAVGRGYVADYLSKLFTQIDWSQVERVQVGGLNAGELSYPESDTVTVPNVPYWWGYSTPAQTGAGLAPRMAVCPVPGHVPSTGTTWVANDVAFVGWYHQSMINWMVWLIEQHRDHFDGPIWVMHPGAGLREVSQTPTGSAALAYRTNAAAGLDWAGQVGSYPDDVHPYSTWVDADHFGTQYYSATFDGDAAPWLHLLRVARAAGRGGRIWGENTGGNTNTDMNRIFQVGAVAHGFEGLGWLSHDSLTSGTDDTYANFATRIATT